jgi:hypothetical protein
MRTDFVKAVRSGAASDPKTVPVVWAILLVVTVVGPSQAADDASGQQQPRKPVPWLTVGVEYALVSDYVWRGIPLSDYRGEGREKPNHQLTVRASVETSELFGVNLGSAGATVWWEWYADQDVLNRLAGNTDVSEHNQEVDYALSWNCDLPEGPLSSVEVGWIYYKFPALHGDARGTQEVYASLGLNDTALWKAVGLEGFSLNPYVACYVDVDDVQGSWIEAGVSREVALADLGVGGVPVLKDMTLTPSVTFGVDHRYMDRLFATGHRSTKLANVTYGLALALDLSRALSIPPRFGSLTLTGFLHFSQNVRDDLPGYHDQWFGGMRFAWEW